MLKKKKRSQSPNASIQDIAIPGIKLQNENKFPENQTINPKPNSKSIFGNVKITIGILVVAVLLAFAASFGNDFVSFDDPVYILDNPLITSPSFASLIKLLKVECGYNFHPLTMASLWLNSFFFGQSASSFIVTNTIIHIINTILVFVFVRKLSQGNIFVSFYTALLWGVHPMHAESVIWIAERKNVLYACFFLLSCIQYIKFLDSKKTKFIVFSFLFFFLSCLAKATAVTLPFVLLLLDYWFDKKSFSYKNLLVKTPFFIASLLFGLLAIDIQAGGDLGGRIEKLTQFNDSAIQNIPYLQKICFGSYGFLVYIIKLFVPFHQHNFYAYPSSGDSFGIQYIVAPIFFLLFLY